jgi:hypothetical protein
MPCIKDKAMTTPIHNGSGEDGLVWGVDKGNLDGDMTAITIIHNKQFYTYVSDEAELILALIQSEKDELLKELLESAVTFEDLPQPVKFVPVSVIQRMMEEK